jgi:hypothetical protein
LKDLNYGAEITGILFRKIFISLARINDFLLNFQNYPTFLYIQDLSETSFLLEELRKEIIS